MTALGKTARRWFLRGVPALVGVLGLSWGIAVWVAEVPTFEAVKRSTRSSEAVLRARDGQILQHLRLDRHQRVLEWVPLEGISPALRNAVIAAEDRHFAWHWGVDPLGMVSAAFDNLGRSRARGASTLTMQVADMFSEDGGRPAGGRGILYKLRQMRDAMAIERTWTKAQIMEVYLNRVAFRGELVGVSAASHGLLGKGPQGLDHADSAVLAALIRAPGAGPARVARRACGVLKAQGLGRACERASLAAMSLPRRPQPMPGVDEAPHLARRLLKRPGESVQVALDADLQRFATATLRSRLAELDQRNVEDGAVVVLDNRTGEVLAYVGSSGDLSGSPDVDGVMALRQPGSTLKPFLFGLAIDQGWLTAASVLDDSPLVLKTPSGLYIPQDYDRHFRGAVSVRSALGSSLNVPAVRALTLVGLDRFLLTLRGFGLDSLTRSADHYGYGLALGGAEVTLLSLTNAYRALANGGTWTPVQWAPANAPAGPSRQALGAQASFVLGDILSDPAARALTFGLSSPLSARTWAAVKTGTSKGMRDNWAIGYTDRYTVGVWVGNFSGASMWDVSGVTGAAPVWRTLVEHLHADVGSRQPPPPSGLVRAQVSFQPELEAPRDEWLLPAQAPGGSASSPAQVVVRLAPPRPQIVAPPDALTIAPDPDIPKAVQSLLLQTSGGGKHCLFLDGRSVARCGVEKVMVALPLPGDHRVELRAADGHAVLDTHVFTVRALAALTRKNAVR